MKIRYIITYSQGNKLSSTFNQNLDPVIQWLTELHNYWLNPEYNDEGGAWLLGQTPLECDCEQENESTVAV